MNTTRSSILVAEVPGYTELQREIRDALRAQHPEWTEADGKSPTCDYYESRFAELLVSHRADARAHYDHLLNITEAERLSATANSSMPVSYTEARNIVFLKSAARSRSLLLEKKGTYEQNHQSNRASHDAAIQIRSR
jgi:hypothetical protein